jgi:transferrin binding protein
MGHLSYGDKWGYGESSFDWGAYGKEAQPEEAMKLACAMFVAAALVGCGGGSGGGGDPGPVSPPLSDSSTGDGSTGNGGGGTASNPTLRTVNSTSALRSYDEVQFGLTDDVHSGSGRTSVSSNGNGSFTVRVRGSFSPSDNPFPDLDFQINVNDANVPLTSVAGTTCGNCIRVRRDGTDTFTILYLDLAASGMQYSTIGGWDRPATLNPTAVSAGGVVVFGVPTRTSEIPTTGTANYAGQFIGRYSNDEDGKGVRIVGASARATANFGSGVVDFNTSNSHANGEPNAALNLTGRMTTGMRTNQMSGTASAPAGGGMTGTMRGSFYGPAAAELSGTVSVRSEFFQHTLIGGFATKK